MEGKAKYKQANILKDEIISDMCHEENWLGEEVGGNIFDDVMREDFFEEEVTFELSLKW